MPTKYRFDAPKFYKDAPLALWSVTNIDHLGNAKCYGHFGSNQFAVELLDIIVEHEPGLYYSARVYHHYGKCTYCGENREGI